MAKVICTELQKDGASGPNITLDTSKNVTCENDLQVDGNIAVTGNVTVTGTLPADKLTGALPAISGANLTGITSSDTLSFRNLIINGSMAVAQRGDITGVEYGYGGCDRWRFSGGSAARITMQRQGTTSSPTDKGFGFCQRLDVTTADASLAAGDYNMLSYKWEGQDLQKVKKGTAAAESITVSFWVSSPKTGTHIVELFDEPNSRQVSKAYTVSAADTWEKKTVTFPADTTGTITNDNAARLVLEFWLCAGSTFSSGTLNTSWASTTNANRAVGQVNCMDDTSNDFLITGVQAELGDTATEFEHRSYGDELRSCQRYYYKHVDGHSLSIGVGQMYSDSNASTNIFFPSTMRTAPSLDATSGTDYYTLYGSGATATIDGTLAIWGSGENATFIEATTDGGLGGGTATRWLTNNNSSKIAFNSEL